MSEIIILYLSGVAISLGFLVEVGIVRTKTGILTTAVKSLFWPMWLLYSLIIWWVNLPD